MPRRLRPAVSPLLVCAALAVAGCTGPALDRPPVPKSLARLAAPPTSGECREDSGWSCTQQQRFAATAAYASHTASGQGYLSVMFTDRRTGRVWRLGPTQHDGWTASTIKLAIATDLLRRERAGQLKLTTADRRDMATMLNFSDNAASDRLWAGYGGEDMLASTSSGASGPPAPTNDPGTRTAGPTRQIRTASTG